MSDILKAAADFKARCADNSRPIMEAQAKMRANAIERARGYMQMRIAGGASAQDAGDGYFRDCMRPKYWPAVYTEVARELFRQLGWVDRKGVK